MVRVLKKLKVTFILYPILLENCDNTQHSNSVNIKKHLEKVDITSNPISNISDPIDFTIEDSISIISDKKHERANSKSIDNSSNIKLNENPLDAYRCSASETVLVNTSCENKFISIAPGENVIPESLTNYIFCEELRHPHFFLLENLGFKQGEKYISHHQNILINVCLIVLKSSLLILITYFLLTQTCKGLILAIR